MLYLVITEEWYGGENKIKIFNDLSLAEQYKEQLGEEANLDLIIEEHETPDPLTTTYHVVVSEEWYGGGKTGVFANLSSAEEYKKKLEEEWDLDIVILMKTVEGAETS